MARLAVVWCPEWPVVAAGAKPGEPAAVLHANRVLAASPAAMTEGVGVGQRRREAQAACPGLVVLDHDPARDARAFEPLLQALEQVTPWWRSPARGPVCSAPAGRRATTVATRRWPPRWPRWWPRCWGRPRWRWPAPPGWGWPTGGSPPRWRPGAPPPRAHRTWWPRGASAPFLAPLAIATLELVEALGPEPASRASATCWPASACAPSARWPPSLPATCSTASAPSGASPTGWPRGVDERPPATRRPPPDLAVQTELEPPVTDVEPVAFVAKQLADELHARLAADGLACTRVVVVAETEHGERQERLWRHEHGLTAPAIAERVRWQLEGWCGRRPAPPTGGISLLRLVPDEVVPDRGRQLGFWGGSTLADERAGAGRGPPRAPAGAGRGGGARVAGRPGAGRAAGAGAGGHGGAGRARRRHPPGPSPRDGGPMARSPAHARRRPRSSAAPVRATVVDAGRVAGRGQRPGRGGRAPGDADRRGRPAPGGGGLGRAVAGRGAVVGSRSNTAAGPASSWPPRTARPTCSPRGRPVVGRGHLRLI